MRTLLIALIYASLTVSAQSFEGWINYEVEILNPMPFVMPDSVWEEKMKKYKEEGGLNTLKYFYKNQNYISQVSFGKAKGYQLYSSRKNALYSWNSEDTKTAKRINANKSNDKFTEIIKTNETQTILGIECKMALVKSELSEMQIWYNENHFKMNSSHYKNHYYGHWNEILKAIQCLPLKIKIPGSTTQVATSFNEEPVNDDMFLLPKFKKVLKSKL